MNRRKVWTAVTAAAMAVMMMLATGVVASSSASGDYAAMDDTVTVRIEVGPQGFDPSEIELETGTPARLVFTRTTDATCAKDIHIPEFDVEKTALPLNEPVAIDVHPDESGAFTFACAMNMMKGAILVKSD